MTTVTAHGGGIARRVGYDEARRMTARCRPAGAGGRRRSYRCWSSYYSPGPASSWNTASITINTAAGQILSRLWPGA